MEASPTSPALRVVSPDGRRLGALLMARGLVSQHQIEAALARQKLERLRLGEVLVRDGLVSDGPRAPRALCLKRMYQRAGSCSYRCCPQDVLEGADTGG